MKKRLLSILLVVAMLLSVFPTAFAAETDEFTPVAVELVNPDFEGNPSELVVPGWEASGFGGWAVGTVCTTYPGNWHITNQTLLFHKDSWASQKVENLVPGATYKLTANMLTRYMENFITMELDMLDADGNVVGNETLDVQFEAALATEAFELEATLPGNCTAAVIKVTNAAESAGWCLVDDFTLTQMTEGGADEAPVYGPIGENLLSNGSFEQLGAEDMPVGLSDWYLTDANNHAWGVKAFLETDPANVTDGSNSLYLKSESSDLMKIGYAVNVEAGKSYIFTYKVKGTTTAPGGMCARINGAYSGSVIPNADSWTTYTYIYESAAAGQIGFEISAAWNAMDVYVDEMAVYEYGEIVEEPEVPVDAAAQIGDTYYATLAEAVAAVPEGETIVLLKDNDETGIVIEKETYFFIDGNACRYDIEKNLLAGPCLSRHASGSPYEEYLAVFQYDYDHNTAYTDNGDGTHDAACDCGATDADNEACVYEEGICAKCGAEEPEVSGFVPVAVELVNPDFESNPSETVVPGWEASGFGAWAVGTVCTTYSNNWHITNQSLVFHKNSWASQKVENLVPGATYKLTANMLSRYAANVVTMEMDMLDADGNVVDNETLNVQFAADLTIEAFELEAVLPDNCTAVVIKVTNAEESGGWCIVDDFTLTQTAEPVPFEPVAVELVNPDFEGNPSEIVVPGWEASGFGAWVAGMVCTTYSNNWHITNQTLLVHKGAWASQKVENLVPGATYRLTANMLGWDDGGAGVLALEMLDASGAVIATESVDAVYGGGGAIGENVVEATLPDGCTSVNIKVSNGAGASMWCLADDFTLTQMTKGNPDAPVVPEEPFEPAAIELKNADLESTVNELDVPGWEASGWAGWQAGKVCGVYDDETITQWAVTGNWCLLVHKGAWASQKVKGLDAEATYKLTANMLGWADNKTNLEVDMLAADGTVLSTESVAAAFGGGGVKAAVELEFTLPADCHAIVIRVTNAEDSVMWSLADDFTLTQLTAGVPAGPEEVFQAIPVKLDNGSFENLTANGQSKGWTPGDGGTGSHVSYVTGIATDGNVSAKMANENNRNAYHVYNDYLVKGLIPGGTYKITYDVKGELTWLGEEGKQGAAAMGLDILNYDYAGTLLSLTGTATVNPTEDWQTVEGVIVLPEGCTRIKIRPGFYNWGGAVYVDNFTLTLVDVPEGVDPFAPTEPYEDDEPKFDPADSLDGVQMIYNPSFEIIDTASGKASGYDYLCQGDMEASTISVNTDPTYVRTGSNSMRLFNDGGASLLAMLPMRTQLTKGATYVLSYWVKGEASVGSYNGMVFGTNAEGDLSTPGVEKIENPVSFDPNRWQNVTVQFVCPADRDYIQPYIGFAWGTGELYLDDVEMYLVSMPGGESIDGLQWLDNGNFEAVTDGVTDGHTFTGDVSVETTEVYEGTNALKMTGDQDTYVTIPVRNAVSGGTYTVSFWHKGELENGSISLTADLYRENDVADATDNFRGTLNAGAAVPGSEWQQFVGVLSIPTNAKYAEVKIGFTEGSGTVYVDDAQMLLVTGPDLATMQPDQVFYYTGEYETGKAIANFYEGYHAADMVEIDFELIDNADGTVLASADNVAIVDDKAVFEFDMDLLTKEQYGYTVRATIYNKGFDNPRMILSDKVYVWDRPLALNANGEFLDGDFDENGNYVPNGEIFTPVIGFEVYGSRGLESGNLKAEHLEKLLEGGINTVLYYIPGGDDSNGWAKTKAELDLLHSYGMKALILMYWGMQPAGHPNNINRQPATVEALKNHPAIYAWYTADEPFSHDADAEACRQQLIDGYKMIREIDPVHPIYYTEDNAPHYIEADHYADIVSIDPYSGAASDYEVRVGDRTAQVTSETDNARPVNNVLQAFTFAGSKPTEVQFQNMLFAAYLGGSRTLGYWCVMDRDPDPVIYERDLWNVITSFNSNEYPIIVEQYADGQGTFVAQSRGSAWYDLWEADGAYYLIVTNRNRSTNVVNVPFDGEIESLELVTQYLADGVKLAETANGFSVTLPASQGVMVKISGEGTEEPEPEEGLKITAQPTDYVGLVGETAEFTVEATGEGLSYQWYYFDREKNTWLKSSGKEATLAVEFKAYRNGQQYKVVITDAEGNSIESEVVSIIAEEMELAFTAQPVSYAGIVNDTVEFTAPATGNGLVYQWYYSTDDGATWQKSYSPGYDTAVLQPILRAYRDGQQYRCEVTDVFGEKIVSDAAVMTVRSSEVTIVAQPENVEYGALSQLYTFKVEAEGDNLSYQWQYSADGGATWKDSYNDGYNTAELKSRLYAYRSGYLYRCVITSGVSNSVITEVAVLKLQPASVKIVKEPVNRGVMAQKTVDIHVEAEGMDLTYQWYRNMATTDAATGETVYKWQKTYLGGYDTDTMSFVANAARCGEYRCVITDGSGALVYSKVIKVSLIDKELVLLSQPKDVEVERRDTVTFTCEADGIDVKYQWFASSDEGETWVETYMDGYNTNELTFTATAARTEKLYKCVITDVGNNVVETEAVSATMK